jgi:hypothetical protein
MAVINTFSTHIKWSAAVLLSTELEQLRDSFPRHFSAVQPLKSMKPLVYSIRYFYSSLTGMLFIVIHPIFHSFMLFPGLKLMMSMVNAVYSAIQCLPY